LTILPTDTANHHQLGGKATALAQLMPLQKTGKCIIPRWFAVPADTSLDGVAAAAQSIGAEHFAVRSSARGEDGAEHSFAGQYDTFLYVKPADLEAMIQAVHQSDQSDHLQTYQSSKKISETHRPTALVQEMITPDISGVAFSVDPVSGRRAHALVSALWGTGTALVSGEADADVWSVDRSGKVVETTLANKAIYHVSSAEHSEGVTAVDTPVEKREVACLTNEQIKAVALLARDCEEHFGCPQDIEWAIQDETLYLLQSRPITTLAHTPDPDDPLTIWDNSNIAESYSGVTSPMTFSFAKRAYEHVYREFCGILSVPHQRIRDNDYVFPEMLGHIHGHVYYNLNSWYHVLAMLPGFSMNRSFMEQMMGVKEPMPDEIVDNILEKTQTGKLKDTWAFIQTLVGLVHSHRGLPQQIEQFYQRLDTALNTLEKPLGEMPSSELREHYNELEAQLLKRWDAPLVNDFLAMIFYGVLKSLCEKWLGDASLQNTLLLDAGDIISAEPPRLINAMAKVAAEDEQLTTVLSNPSIRAEEKLAQLRGHSELYAQYESYLEKFGDRCLEELKLESPTVDDNPQALLTGIGVMAKRHRDQPHTNTATQETIEEPSEAELALAKLSGIKKRLFHWVLRNAKDRVRDRENLRFERTRLFGRVRQIIVQLGHHYHRDGTLDAPEDIFWLTIGEAMNAQLSNEVIVRAVATRKAKFESFTSPPPDRFETRGPLTRYLSFQPTKVSDDDEEGDLTGTGACPGVVTGKVRVITDPRNATLLEGEILVAQQTDPGWVVLFPAASGLLVERGSLLSHSAIVARELQLPCVVSISKVTSRLKTGDLVEMNGSTGSIKILEPEQTNDRENDHSINNV